MKIFRVIAASVLVLVFSLAAVVAALGYGLDSVINPQAAAEIIEKTKAGERLSAALPALIKSGLTGPAAQLRLEDVKKFTAEALSAEQADAILRSVSADVIEFVRGHREAAPVVDLAPIEKRAEAAAKKAFPGLVGTQLALMIQAQFKASGFEKGLEIPREQLAAARSYFSQIRLINGAALAVVLATLLLVFAVSARGLAGRLRWCGAAFIAAGFASAAVASLFLAARKFAAGLSFGGSAPPEAKDLLKDAIGTLAEMMSKNMFLAAASCLVVGAALIILNFVFRKTGPASRPIA